MRFVKKINLIVFLCLFILLMSTIILAQYEPGTEIDETNDNQAELRRETLNDKVDDKVMNSQKGGFYKIHGYYWPKITFGGNVTAVIAYLALFFGFASFFIGHNAGGRLNKKKIFASIITASLIGIFSRSIVIKLQLFFFNFLTVSPFKMDELIAGTIVYVIFYIINILFVSSVAVYFYETFTVTAKEAFPVGK